MSNALSDDMIREYRRSEFCFPYRVLSVTEARSYRDEIEQHQQVPGEPLTGKYSYKVPLLFTWPGDLIRHPKILTMLQHSGRTHNGTNPAN